METLGLLPAGEKKQKKLVTTARLVLALAGSAGV